VYSQWIGTTVGFIDAEIHSKVTGYLLAQDYREGSFVNTGDLLFEVDPRPFQAIVDQAKAQLNVASAGLTQAKADVDAAKAEIDRAEAAQLKTELDVKRYSPLVKDGTVSQQELDDAVQSNLANLASVAAAKGKFARSNAAVTAAEAQIEVARSSLQAAELNLGFTKVKSPISGIAGIRAANIGDLVGNGPANPPDHGFPDRSYFGAVSHQRAGILQASRFPAGKKCPAAIFLGTDTFRREHLSYQGQN